MDAFTTHHGKVVILDRANVDTDQIIPKQFLKSIKRTGFEDGLFFDWRFLPDGKPNPDFELNKPAVQGATVLITQNNFGCGSSREHAVWALVQYGLKVIIAPKRGEVPAFADIFYNNSVKNGLLCVTLPQEQVDEIITTAKTHLPIVLEATVDLTHQKVTIAVPNRSAKAYPFEINASVKDHLVRGLDDIGLSLQYGDAIAAFEKNHDAQMVV